MRFFLLTFALVSAIMLCINMAKSGLVFLNTGHARLVPSPKAKNVRDSKIEGSIPSVAQPTHPYLFFGTKTCA